MSTKTCVLALGLLALACTGRAQTAPAPTATELTREMAQRLQLNEGQFVRLLAINRTRMARQHEIELATQSNAAARSAQMAELQGQYEQECSRVLSASQLAQLQQEPQAQPTGVANGNG